ncbi:TauD/TfdA family dioxygenase [Niveispirillum sp. KHB5.9]|uniref:TauD/TfdA family dioxygenase n=1 Tax=Niveispirillum sp. KHB5.9 TaxID=3400269 RepID=UPI003A8B29EA
MSKVTAMSMPTRLLTHLRDLGPRTGEFAVAPIDRAQVDAALAVLADHYGGEVDPAKLVPPERDGPLRGDLALRAPYLSDLAGELRDRLEGNYSAVVIPRLGLDGLPLPTRSALMFALSASLGLPTATDQVDRRVVWDVKVREEKVKNNSVSTFSEHPFEADLHTDTQYFARPERYMMLYFIVPASCGGGISTSRDLGCLRDALSASDDGRWAMQYLTGRDLPFRIPAVFTQTGKADKVEVTFAPIFGTRPAVRFRTDTLRKGLDLYPDYDTVELRRALSILNAEVARQEKLVSIHMPADGLQVLNNHEALHGRSPFADYRRHVLRIRVAETGVPGLDMAA